MMYHLAAFRNLRALFRLQKACAFLFVLLVLTGCGSGFKQFPPGTVLSISPTTVWLYPQENEDLSGPCIFDLLLQQPEVVQSGTLVIYERGDSRRLYEDKILRASAQDLHYSIIWAHECDAVSTGAFQADASKGQGRVLFSALDQFAANTSHPELANGGVVIYGFSAAAVLAATLANEQPDRLLGAVEYAAGDSHVNLENVLVSQAAAQVPTLLLANAEDEKAGTYRSLDYFKRGRSLGALWAYGVQNGTDHCCTLSTRKLLMPFLQALAVAQTIHVADPLASKFPGQTFSTFTCIPDKIIDAQGYTDCAISEAAVTGTAPLANYGWLPDRVSASAWLGWVLSPTTN